MSQHRSDLSRLACVLPLAVAINTVVLIVPAAGISGAAAGIRGADLFMQPTIWAVVVLVNVWMAVESVSAGRWNRLCARRACWRGLPLWIGFSIYLSLATALAFPRSIDGVSPWVSGVLIPTGVLVPTGTFFIAVGIALRVAAINTLRDHFLNEIGVAENHPLVTKRVYGCVRHPSELGTLLSVAGVCLMLESHFGLIIFLTLLLPGVLIRIGLEERVLVSEFTDAFEQYRRQVPLLIPLPGWFQFWSSVGEIRRLK